MLTDREKQISMMVDNIMTQEEWEKNKRKHIEKLFKKYNTELENYIWLENLEEYENIKLGGYIRYVNMNDEIKWGGILVKKRIKLNGIHMMTIKNSKGDLFDVSFEKNYVFYKNHVSSSDKMRELFISYLDKEKYNV